MQRLWSLIEDLTNQLQANRQLCESLQQQADQLRGQAIHSGTGFALRRFNTDLSKEKFESELEALNAHLVKENLSLSHENKQQAVLLREYENTLETVMAKFRSFSHSTQQHTLQLTQHYESLLAQTTHNAAEQTLAAETAFSGTLTHLVAWSGGQCSPWMERSVTNQTQTTTKMVDRHARQSVDGSRIPKLRIGGVHRQTTDPIALRADEALEHLTEEESSEWRTIPYVNSSVSKRRAMHCCPQQVLPMAQPKLWSPAPAKPLSPAERRASLTVDEAAIAAEASGQPPNKALQVSSSLVQEKSTASPSQRRHHEPRRSSYLSWNEKIRSLKMPSLPTDENVADRGRRGSESSPLTGTATQRLARYPQHHRIVAKRLRSRRGRVCAFLD